MIKIDNLLLNQLTQQAKLSPRKRMNYNFHKTPDDLLQRMLNAIEPDSYIRPHKHENPDKREAFFALRGSFVVFEFDNNGSINDFTILKPENGNFGVEIAPRIWHSIVALESGTVAYEVKDGPYNPLNDKNFAAWAPAEGDASAAKYLESLIENLSKMREI